MDEGFAHLELMRQEAKIIEDFEAKIKANEGFEYKVTELRVIAEPIGDPSKNTTTCLNCKFTCHSDCVYSNNDEKKDCVAMDSNGKCTVCPQKCIWSKHHNCPYVYRTVEEEVRKTHDDLKKKYYHARDGKMTKEIMIYNLAKKFAHQEMEIRGNILEIRRNLARLQVKKSKVAL
jgi:Pyruvate/2-oxoacid:ferredoxin oxidoreductase delta subunit